MKEGTPVSRSIVVILKNGTAAVDWGNDRAYDILSGNFVSCTEDDISHPITTEELEQFKLSGVILRYDHSQVYLRHLPELPLRAID